MRCLSTTQKQTNHQSYNLKKGLLKKTFGILVQLKYPWHSQSFQYYYLQTWIWHIFDKYKINWKFLPKKRNLYAVSGLPSNNRISPYYKDEISNMFLMWVRVRVAGGNPLLFPPQFNTLKLIPMISIYLPPPY